MTATVLELWVFDEPVTCYSDNEPFAPTHDDLAKLVGVFPVNENIFEAYDDLVNVPPEYNRPFSTKQQTASLYGVLVVREAYTPEANELFQSSLGIVSDRV